LNLLYVLVVSRAAGFIHRRPKRVILELPFLFGLREFYSGLLGHKFLS
jgi:hypothetical protein